MQAAQSRGRRQPLNLEGLGRAVRYLGKQRRAAIITYSALVVATLAQLVVPQLVKNMIDAVANGAAANTILDLPPIVREVAIRNSGLTLDQLQYNQINGEALLINAALLIVVFSVLRAIFSFVQVYMAENVSQGLAFDFRNEIFTRLQRLSFSYYDRMQTGQLMIRATDDVEKVRLFIAQGLMLAVQSVLLLVATLIILVFINWRLTLVILPVLPVAMIMFFIFGAVSQPLFGALQVKISALNTVLQENVAGIKVVKAFTREPYEQKRYDVLNRDLFDQSLRISRIFALLFPAIFFISQLGQVVLIYFGGRQIIATELLLGEYQQFSLYLALVFLPLGQMGFIISLMAQAAASADRIFEILDAESDVVDKPGAVELPQITGHVEFRNVSFKYFSSGEPVLRHVSFVTQAGQTVALLGATGSGKTTIINLLPRFYDVYAPKQGTPDANEYGAGAVLIDGHDVRDVTLDSLRSQIGIVLQETNLFSGTVRDNIAFGRPEASLEDVMAAAKAAEAHDFIMTFPDGYDTQVGERGATLSGGQKQRMAIARALLLNPRLLILDDSTSSVDLLTESRIQRALDNLMKGRTSFVIAQRISTVVNADLILVLDKGKVVATGRHADLMEHSPIYAEIYNSQLVEDAVVEQADLAANPEES